MTCRKQNEFALEPWLDTLKKIDTETEFVVISIGCGKNEQQCLPNFVKKNAEEKEECKRKKIFVVNIDYNLDPVNAKEQEKYCQHKIQGRFDLRPDKKILHIEEKLWFNPLQKILDDEKKLVIMFNCDGFLPEISENFIRKNKSKIGKHLTIILSHEDPEPSVIINEAFIDVYGNKKYPLHGIVFCHHKSHEQLLASANAHKLHEFSAKYGKILSLDKIELGDLTEQADQFANYYDEEERLQVRRTVSPLKMFSSASFSKSANKTKATDNPCYEFILNLSINVAIVIGCIPYLLLCIITGRNFHQENKDNRGSYFKFVDNPRSY